jgi:hypothetical protein
MKLKFFLVKGTERVIPKINKILSEILAEPAEILNPFSPRSFFFFNFALLSFPDRIFTELFDS